MSEASQTLEQATLPGIPARTSSAAFSDGNTPLTLPDGRPAAKSGPALALASLSARPGANSAPPTRAIFGQSGSA